MMVFTVISFLSLLVFIGEAQMYKLKKNCGNIFSKYGSCRDRGTAWFASNVVIHIPCTVAVRHYVLI